MKNNLIKSLLLTFIAMMLPQLASAYDFMVDGLCYDYNEDGTSVTVTYETNVQYSSHYTNLSGALNIPSSVTYNGINYSVTSIGETAFYGCIGVTSVNIGNSVTEIGSSAFEWCSSLTSLVIPNSVTTIGQRAFCTCNGLTSVTIPNSVTSIGYLAFSYCSSLAELKVESGNTKYDSRDNCNAIIETETNILIAGCKNTIIPNSVTSIGESAFERCTSLTFVTIPNSVTSIGKYAFNRCSGLTSVNIPNSVTSIGEYAFRLCSGLTSVNIGNSVTSIGNFAFESCTSLTSLVIPNSVTLIGEYAFRLCSGLTSVNIGNSVTSIGNFAFEGCTSLTSLVIPNSVTTIGQRAFCACSGLTSVNIGNSVTSIDETAFTSCNDLAEVKVESGNTKYDSRGNCNAIIETETNILIAGCKNTIIPNTVISIGNYAFFGCSGLTSVTIPNSVTSIGGYAFYGCSGLSKIYCEILNPLTINEKVFSNYNANLNVNFSSVNAYQTTPPWNRFNVIADDRYVNSIAFESSNLIINVGDIYILNATVLPETALDKSLTWISSDPTVATVNDNGNVTALKRGSATITATSNDGTNITASCLVTVIQPATGITLNEHNHTLNYNGNDIFSFQLTATITPSNANISAVQWTSSNENVAIVTNRGKITSVGLGVATITATTTDGSNLSDSCIVTVLQLATEITLDQQAKTLNVGESFTLAPNVLPENTNDKTVTWSSSNATVASVDSLGNVTALKRGSATITATTNDGSNLSASCVVTVFQPVTGITLNEHNHTLNYNGNDIFSFQLSATTTPSNANISAVQWTSSNENVATVSSDGTVTSTGKGIATITATTTDGTNLSDTCIVSVLQLATEISLDQQAKTLNVGESFTLTPTVLPENTNDKSVTWSSNNPTVASVDYLGNVTALKRGTATITATTTDGSNLSASCVVSVLQPVTGITLNRHEHTLYNGTSSSDLRSFQLSATTTPSNANNSAVQWTSSNDSVATVTSDGTVSAVSRGTATITATTTDGSNLSDSCIVTVEQLVTGINFNFPSSINVGQTVILAPTVLPENANNHNVGCSSSNYDVAYVDVLPPNFAITGVSRGTVRITLRATDIGHYSCEHFLTVLQPVTGISLNENSHTLMYNGQQTYSFNLVATATPSNANNKNVTWSSSDESVATVNNSGKVTSQGLGTAVITATTADGSNLSDSCLVTVNPVPTTSISIDKVKETVIMGNTVQITGTVDEAAYIKTFNWTSSNDAVASVDQNGLVRGVGAGTASITATTIDGSNLSASCIVQVLYPSNAAGAGDVNEDGRIDITDATLIISYLQGNYPMAVLDEALMDVTGDGDINMSDVLRVISLIRND